MALKTTAERESERQQAVSRIDVSADATAILRAATQTAAAILTRRREMDEAGLADRPLVVLAGEHHGTPAHCLHHLAVLDQVLAAEPQTVFLKEIPHDVGPKGLSALFEARTGRPATAGELSQIAGRDRDGSLSMTVLSQKQMMTFAPHSHETLNQALLRRGVPVHLGDTAVLPSYDDNVLDHNDPSTAASLEACTGFAAEGIKSASPQGMYARNHHMLAQATAFAAEHNARIAIQQCGHSHVMGGNNHDPGESLAAMCKEQGISVLALPIEDVRFPAHSLPSGHGLEADEWIAVSGLPEHDARYFPDSDDAYPFWMFPSRPEEAAYVNNVLEHMGLEDDRLSVNDFKLKREYNACALNEAVDSIAAATPTQEPLPAPAPGPRTSFSPKS